MLWKKEKFVTVAWVEYLDDLPSYWPIPEVNVVYILDLSDPKSDIKDKDGKLLPVDALICNKVHIISLLTLIPSFTGLTGSTWKGSSGASDSKLLLSIFGEEGIICQCWHQKCAGVHVCQNMNTKLLKDWRDLNLKSLKDVINAQIELHVNETNLTAKRTLMWLFLFCTAFSNNNQCILRFFSVVHSKPCQGEKSDGTRCDGHPVMRAQKKVCHYFTSLHFAFISILRTGFGSPQSFLLAVQIGTVFGRTMTQPEFQKMLI